MIVGSLAAGFLTNSIPLNGRSAPSKYRTLRELGRAKGVSIGAATSAAQLYEDRSFADVLLSECDRIVPEWEMKWSAIYSVQGRVDLGGMDKICSFAKEKGLRVRGHPLIWHARLPVHIQAEIDAGRAKVLLKNHVSFVMSRYQDVIDSWDVVNEAILPSDGNSNGFRSSPWFSALGPSYIHNAFELAREFAPNARLVYNDYNVEYDGVKADAVLSLLKSLTSARIPIDAVGLQSHLWATRRRIEREKFIRFCGSIRDLGLEILVTELDVRENQFEYSTEHRDRVVSKVVEEYLKALLSVAVPKELCFWGLSDRYSWLSKPQYNPENPRGYVNRGLILDEKLARKEVWATVFSLLDKIK